MTVTRSLMLRTSFSLWVIRMMDFPAFTKDRRILNSASISGGDRTDVDSSKIRMSAPR